MGPISSVERIPKGTELFSGTALSGARLLFTSVCCYLDTLCAPSKVYSDLWREGLVKHPVRASFGEDDPAKLSLTFERTGQQDKSLLG